jgi:hypothetical protein
MKFMVEDKKKQIIYIVIIVLCLGGAGWVWFGGSFGGSEELLPPALGGTSRPDSQILPFGSKLDITIFSDPRYKELKDMESLVITKEELGRSNPFLTPSSTAQ